MSRNLHDAKCLDILKNMHCDTSFHQDRSRSIGAWVALEPRKPVLPVGIEDYQWSDNVLRKNKLIGRKYAVLEYNSYSLSGPPHNATMPIDWYNKMLSQVHYPVVFTGAPNDMPLMYRDCTPIFAAIPSPPDS